MGPDLWKPSRLKFQNIILRDQASLISTINLTIISIYKNIKIIFAQNVLNVM